MKQASRNIYYETLPYPALRGMDLTGESGVAYLENMYVDHEGSGGKVESFVGYRRIRRMKNEIHSLCIIGEGDSSRLLVHSGGVLYFSSVSERDRGLPVKGIAELEDKKSYAMPLGSLCLFTDGKRIISVNSDGEVRVISEAEDIAGCRCAAVFDGRLFLSGNPDYPSRVFYSARMADGKIDVTNSLDEEIGGSNILSLITLDGYLLVLHSGGILCHKAENNSEAVSYPVARVIDGIQPRSTGIIHRRELLFMTADGLMAIVPPYGEAEIKLSRRSEKINKMLLREDQSRLRLGSWMGYLVLSYGERIYLADPSGEKKYEWYLISGVGGYKNDRRVYRYRRDAQEGCKAHPTPHEIAKGEIYSYGRADGELIYYSKEDGERYSVYPTAQLHGGDFYPASELLCHGGLMWFASDDGALYLFNSDKRGRLPDDIDFSDGALTDGATVSKDEIHPLYYSFAGHAPRYIIVTHPKEQRLTAREGGCVGRSIDIRLSGLRSGRLRFIDILNGRVICERIINAESSLKSPKNEEGRQDANGFRAVSLSDKSALNGQVQHCLIADGFASPFGLVSIAKSKREINSTKTKRKEN